MYIVYKTSPCILITLIVPSVLKLGLIYDFFMLWDILQNDEN